MNCPVGLRREDKNPWERREEIPALLPYRCLGEHLK
jgi:hypothetical protein